MRVKTARKIGGALVLTMIGILGVMVVIAWTSFPPQAPAGEGAAPRVTERTSEVEGAFCSLLAAGLSDQRYGTALSQSGELQHQTLGALAGRWGQDGSAGARAQVLMECRRLGLTP